MTVRDGQGLLTLILAGGKALRMGGHDKAFIELAGRPLIEHVIGRCTGRLAISANGDASRFARFEVPVLPDHTPGQGPLAAIEAGLTHARSIGCRALVTVTCDTPFLPLDLTKRLGETTAPAAYAKDATGAHPTCALWQVDLLSEVTAAIDRRDLKLMNLLTRVGAEPVMFDDPDAFFNINTPEDLATAEAMAARSHMPRA